MMVHYSYSPFSHTHYWRFNKGVLRRDWWYQGEDGETQPGLLYYDSERGDDLLEMHRATEEELRNLFRAIFNAKRLTKAENK
jgi:hypothetical protein